jgi:hypothetical protein
MALGRTGPWRHTESMMCIFRATLDTEINLSFWRNAEWKIPLVLMMNQESFNKKTEQPNDNEQSVSNIRLLL